MLLDLGVLQAHADMRVLPLEEACVIEDRLVLGGRLRVWGARHSQELVRSLLRERVGARAVAGVCPSALCIG